MAYKDLRPLTDAEKLSMHARIETRQTMQDCEIGYNYLKGRKTSKTSIRNFNLSMLYAYLPFFRKLQQERKIITDPAQDTQTTQAIKKIEAQHWEQREREFNRN